MLYDAAIINVRPEALLHGIHVGFHCVSGELNATIQTRGEIANKRSRVRAVTLPDPVRGNELAVGVERNVGPEVAILSRIVGGLEVALFLADVAPNLIHLKMAACEPAHLRIHEER